MPGDWTIQGKFGPLWTNLPRGGGGGGTLIFSSHVGLDPASTVYPPPPPKKNLEYQAYPKNI